MFTYVFSSSFPPFSPPLFVVSFRIADIQPGDIVVDPCCGMGTIPIGISYHIISYHIISYHIISYHIISYHILLLNNI